ncbi:MAG: family 1 glycosylhydrolase, partial [Bdellovibrionota bacterium]
MNRWTMLWGIVFLLLLPQEGFSAYPKGFLWGAAWSAHQTEGSTGGGEAGDWYRFEHPVAGSSPITHGDTADVAVDHWNRYAEDLDQAKNLGLNTVRTSLSWEKIEPAPGVFSTSAIAHYREELQAMRARGLRPMIALQHFTHPQWFNDRGGWTNPDAPRYFLDYATRVVKELGPLSDLWITFNEPMVLVVMGYLKGEVPPQLSSLDAAYEAAYQLVRAHRMVASMIHRQFFPWGRVDLGELKGVGLANSFQIYDPADSGSLMDRRAADTIADLTNWAFIRGVMTGHVVFTMPPEVPNAHSFSRDVPASDTPPWENQPALDWLGVNYYTKYLIAYDPLS